MREESPHMPRVGRTAPSFLKYLYNDIIYFLEMYRLFTLAAQLHYKYASGCYVLHPV